MGFRDSRLLRGLEVHRGFKGIKAVCMRVGGLRWLSGFRSFVIWPLGSLAVQRLIARAYGFGGSGFRS